MTYTTNISLEELCAMDSWKKAHGAIWNAMTAQEGVSCRDDVLDDAQGEWRRRAVQEFSAAVRRGFIDC